MKPWLAQTLSMAARVSDFKLAYWGFRSSRGTCIVDIVIAGDRSRQSNRLAPGSHSGRRRIRSLELLPQAASRAGFADQFQEGLVGQLLVGRGGDDAQADARAQQRSGRGARFAALRRAALP